MILLTLFSKSEAMLQPQKPTFKTVVTDRINNFHAWVGYIAQERYNTTNKLRKETTERFLLKEF